MPYTSNSYFVGSYIFNDLSVYNKDGSLFRVLPISDGLYEDFYLIKYNTNGFVQWAVHSLVDSNNNEALSVETDSDENVYVIGYFTSSTLQFYNSDGALSSISLTRGSSSTIFIVKYNSSGFVQWATTISGSTSNVREQRLTIDSSNNLYVGITYLNTVSIYNSDGTLHSTLSNLGLTDVGVIKFSSAGFVIWTTRIAEIAEQRCHGIKTDVSNNLYVCGRFESDDLIIYNSDGSIFTTLTGLGIGLDKGYLVKYSSSGNAQWVSHNRSLSSPLVGLNITRGVAIDLSFNVYSIITYENNQVELYSSNGTLSSTLTNSGDSDVGLIKYNSSGIVQWATSVRGSADDFVFGIETSIGGNIYICGRSGSSTLSVFNSDGSTSASISNSTGRERGYLSKFNSAGFNLWNAFTTGTSTSTNTYLEVDNDENIYLVGMYGASSSSMVLNNSDGSQFTTLSISGSVRSGIYNIKYDKDGFIQWAANGLSNTGLSSQTTTQGVAIFNIFEPDPPAPPRVCLCPNYGKPVVLNNHSVHRQFSTNQRNAMRLRTGLKLR